MTRSVQSATAPPMPDEAVADFIAATEAEQLDLHSVLLLHHGELIAAAYRAPFDAATPHRMYSVTKSFVSTAVGLAVADGLLTVDTRVVDIFPELAPDPVDAHLGALSLKHMLTMSAEHPLFPGQPLPRAAPSVAGYLAEKLVLPPGSRFEYSSPSSYMLAAAVERVTGEPLREYLRPRLFDPLGIEVRHWLRSEEGVTNGGWGLHLTTAELSRFGQLYLQRGVWKGERLLPEAWIDEATSQQVASWGNAGATDWNQGYCYQFWRSRHDSYRADGLLGQFCLVMPGVDAVMVTTAGTMTTQRLLDLAWERLLPALGGGGKGAAAGVSPAFPATRTGGAASPRGADLSGVTFVFGEPFNLPTRFYGGQAPIVSARIVPEGGAMTLHLTDRNATYRLPVGINAWAGGTSPVSTGYAEPYKGFARYETPDVLVVKLVFTEAAFRLTLTFDTTTRQLSVRTPANPGLEGRVVVGRPFP